jgi:diguanylate cyclase (GGDEF)-like protein
LAIAETGIETGAATLHVTISPGVSVLSPDDERIEQVLKRADDAMYEAKRGGRNRTMTAAS